MHLHRFAVRLSVILFSTVFFFVGFLSSAHAANPGSILTGFNEAHVIRDSTIINFGLFTTASDYDIKVYDTYLKGYAWGEKVGWISLNCANELVNNCDDNNNFHVSNNTSGELSGWAWGQKTGWINFGPFDNNSADTVVIDPSNGEFDGWAWAQKIGWIKFDCEGGTACVKTDWEPASNNPACSDGIDNDGDGLTDYPTDSGCFSSSDTSELGGPPPTPLDVCPNIDGFQASIPIGYTFENNQCVLFVQPTYVCSNGLDDDRDGLIDLSDPGCDSVTDTNEFNQTDFEEYACSDGIDNDGDNLADYPSDPGCSANNDNSEYNTIETDEDIDPPTCEDLGTCTPVDESCITLGNCPIEEIPTCETNPSLCGEPDVIDPPIPSPIVNPPKGDPTVGGGSQIVDSVIQKLSNIDLNPFPKLLGDVSTANLIGLLGILGALFAIPYPLIRSLIAFFYKNKRRPWGTVYDSVTKQPLDPAYVILRDESGADVTNAVTDIDGRYGFLQKIGFYTLFANKTNYTFPSVQLAGKNRDELYEDLYFGEKFELKNENDVIMRNIPMDPVSFDWNQFAKNQRKLMGYYHRRDVFLARLANVVFWVGFGFSIFAIFQERTIINFIILALYVVLFVLRNTVFKHKASGMVVDSMTNLPIPFALIKIYFATLNKEVAHAVSDVTGRYYKLIASGTYYVTIDKKNDDGSYTTVYKSEPMEIQNGVINKIFMV